MNFSIMCGWYAVPPDELTKLVRRPEFSETLAGEVSPIIFGLNQAYVTYLENHLKMLRDEKELKQLISATPEKEELRKQKIREITTGTHNYLSSFYSLSESVKQSYAQIGVLGKYNTGQIKKFREKTPVLHGLRTYAQHVRPLNITWMVEKGDNRGELDYEIGVWLGDVADEDFYEEIRLSSGKKVDSIKHYYGGVEREFIDIFAEVENALDDTEEFFHQSVGNICDEVVAEVDEFTDTEREILYEAGVSIPDPISGIVER